MGLFDKLVKQHDFKRIKKHIYNSFKYKKGANKTLYFYKCICILYPEYPETVKQILDDIPKWGYYKDYLLFLQSIDNLCYKQTGYKYTRKQDGKYIEINPDEYENKREDNYADYKNTLNNTKINNQNVTLNDNNNTIKNNNMVVYKKGGKTHYIHKFMSDKLKLNKNYHIKVIYRKQIHWTSKLAGMKSYIYNIIVNKLKEDVLLRFQGQEISTLAKFLPRSEHMFAKNIKEFMKTFTGMYYDVDISEITSSHKYLLYKKYNRLIIDLSSYLNVTEYYIKTNQLEKIDFNNVPSKCLISNKKSFIKNPICEQNFGNHIYNKYKNKSLNYLVNIIIKHDVVSIEKQMFNKIFTENLEQYKQAFDVINIDYSQYDVFVDFSKSVYDNKNIDMLIAVLTVLNGMGLKIIINGKRCHVKNFTQDFCNNINILSFSMIDCDILNFKSARLLTNKKLLVIADENKIQNIDQQNIDDIFIVLNKFGKLKQKTDNLYVGSLLYKHVQKTNKRDFMKILHNSVELNSERVTSVTLLVRFVAVLIPFIIFVNCILFFMQFIV